MRVLVTGNLGYIGPVLTRALHAAGHSVVGLDTGWYLSDYAEDPEWPDVQVFGDIRTVEPAQFWQTHNIDVAVHLAGLSNDPIGDLDPALTNAINFVGTARMLIPGVRNVVVSSCSVYGTSDGSPSTEESDTNPLTAYARAKAAVDQYLVNFGGVIGVASWASLRLGTVWGWSPGHRLDLVVNRMVSDALYGGVVTANGNPARPIVHVADVARAILHFIERDDTGIYNIVGENIRIEPLAERVAAAVVERYDGYVAINRRDAGADQRDYMASGAKAAAAGWLPMHTLGNSLGGLVNRTARMEPGIYERLPIARHFLEGEIAA